LKQKSVSEHPHKTLAKALEVLEAFSANQDTWGVRELSREVEINPATVYRILQTLKNKGYLEQNEDQSYSLGPQVLKLANLYSARNPLPAIAKKVFESFADRFEHNLYLGMLNQFEVIYLAVLDGRGPIKIAVEPGLSLPLHSNAMGKVLLAFEDKEFIEKFLENNQLKTFTARTISGPEELLKQLEVIRQQGYAINDGEQFDSVGAVAVHLSAPERHPINLAVSLTYPRHFTHNGTLNIDTLITLGQEIAQEIKNRCNINDYTTGIDYKNY